MKIIKISLPVILSFFTFYSFAQINLAGDYNFEDNTYILNPSGVVETGTWYASLKGSSNAVFDIVKDETAGNKVFHAATKVINNREDACLAQKVGDIECKKYVVGFWFKMMHRNARMRVEVKGFDFETGNPVADKKLMASMDINYGDGTVTIPGNWAYYEMITDLTNEDVALVNNKYITVVFYFNNSVNATTLNNPGTANEAWEFYISNLSISEGIQYVTDGGFEKWTTTYPVAPVNWTTESDGNVCFERCNGHKFSDYGLKADVFNSGSMTQVQTKTPVTLPGSKFKLLFWAKADKANAQLQLEIPEIGEVIPVTLTKEYKMYNLSFNNTNKTTSGKISFKLMDTNTYYIDQVKIEEDNGNVVELNKPDYYPASNVYTTKGKIIIETETGDNIKIYNISGISIYGQVARKNIISLPATKGCYIVSIGSPTKATTTKVCVQ